MDRGRSKCPPPPPIGQIVMGNVRRLLWGREKIRQKFPNVSLERGQSEKVISAKVLSNPTSMGVSQILRVVNQSNTRAGFNSQASVISSKAVYHLIS